MACRSTLCLIVIRASQRVSCKKCLNFLARSCPCPLRNIRRPTDKLSASNGYWLP
ncbi:hypothetical protein PR003_g2164 [Phytophthora rubi]|uniref:Uncharacterized protein n=1 Tax=Phytophthora rubi TaxID=129364 RepID=A0A6A4G0T5_9STRA|nr:hypothetical protein PR002_g5473 [Phytophthora rubi]KAE9045092.1 hypothetical protein PR001_g5109 [Phytophthora rubi]KAE9356733.1 hypothetical protein PR003_g2164 [Phytophthora rubi]